MKFGLKIEAYKFTVLNKSANQLFQKHISLHKTMNFWFFKISMIMFEVKSICVAVVNTTCNLAFFNDHSLRFCNVVHRIVLYALLSVVMTMLLKQHIRFSECLLIFYPLLGVCLRLYSSLSNIYCFSGGLLST